MAIDETRVIEAKTSFGDAVHVAQLSGVEQLGQPFSYRVELMCDDLDLNLDDTLGKPLTVNLIGVCGDGEYVRFFSGLVSEMAFAGTRGRHATYVAAVRPKLWFLAHSSDNRIFQEQSVPDIVKSVLSDNAVDFRDNLTGSYDTREYCVQYGETDLDFVQRLLEEEGIYYYFQHEDGRHTMVLADDYSSHGTSPAVPFRATGTSTAGLEHIDSWAARNAIDTQAVVFDSYDFEKPKTDLQVNTSMPKSAPQFDKERYEYGRLYDKDADKDQIARVRMQEHAAKYAVVVAGGETGTMACGGLFSLEDHPRDAENQEYLVTRTSYFITSGGMESGQDAEGTSVNCEFQALQSRVPYRPPRITSKAVVRGPQTAVVVGKSGEEIWTDKYGRVKVQFHWDREGQQDENSTCWVRVSTSLAGQNWGFVAIPRIGQEVLVDFLEGDPDQPIIVGSVYNEDNQPPYKLPDNQTQSGLKSRSTKSGSKDNFNELRFEDKKDSEEIYFHAEKDFNRVVENNDTLKVGLDKKDPGDQTIEIHNNRTATLNEGDDTLKVKKGNQNIDVKQKIDIKAGDQLTITVGQSKLVMKKDGTITWTGKDISAKANMNIKLAAQMKFDAKGALGAKISGLKTDICADTILDLKASAMAKLKGGVTMIG